VASSLSVHPVLLFGTLNISVSAEVRSGSFSTKSVGRAYHLMSASPQNNRCRAIAKKPICFSPYLYRARNLVERFFNKIKQCAVGSQRRYDKLAANYLAFVQLALTRLWLRGNVSTPWWGKLMVGVAKPQRNGRAA
jgi:hypothetical protein